MGRGRVSGRRRLRWGDLIIGCGVLLKAGPLSDIKINFSEVITS